MSAQNRASSRIHRRTAYFWDMRWIWIVVSFFASPAMAQDIRVEISKIRHREGELVVAIFDNQQSFLKKPFRVVRLQPVGDKVETIITGVAPVPTPFPFFMTVTRMIFSTATSWAFPRKDSGFPAT